MIRFSALGFFPDMGALNFSRSCGGINSNQKPPLLAGVVAGGITLGVQVKFGFKITKICSAENRFLFMAKSSVILPKTHSRCGSEFPEPSHWDLHSMR